MSKFNADDDIKLYEEWCEHNKNNLPISFAEYCYEQGRTNRDKELAEHNVFCSNRPIEDLVLDAIAEERERIVNELINHSFEIPTDTVVNKHCVDLYKAIEITRGGENE